MEIVLIICLIIVIALLVWDKIGMHPNRNAPRSLPSKPHKEADSIMGLPKSLRKLPISVASIEITAPTAAVEYNSTEHQVANEDYDLKMQHEEPVENLRYVPDFDEEEEEWRNKGEFYADTGFATGVTFEELSTVNILIRSGMQEPALTSEGVKIIRKIEGTELLNFIESSMEASSQKLSKLLGQSSLTINILENTDLQTDSADPFDINDFV